MGTIDLAPLCAEAFFTCEPTNASEAIDEARGRFSDAAKMDGFSYEVSAPERPDREWLIEGLVRPLIYFCESSGAPLPACPGVFVSLFVGQRLFCIVAAEVIAWAGALLGEEVKDLGVLYGTHESDTALR
jgi:hypothetical protein